MQVDDTSFHPLSQRFIQSFWNRVKKTDGCWIWQGKWKTKAGYGLVRPSGWPTVSVHRISWFIVNGSFDKSLEVCHDCPNGDNKLCVNPEHLWLGTRSQNCLDSVVKGYTSRGEGRHSHILTAMDVTQIRMLYSNRPHKETAELFGVKRKAIGDVLNFKTWKHIQ